MPHRTVFQWGKNHAHPFTMFIGGVVVGALVTAAAGYAWFLADEVNEVEIEDNAAPTTVDTAASPEASVEPTATPAVQF